MWGTKTSELLSWLRLNRTAALLAVVAILSQALVPSWVPVFAATPGMTIVICTAMGPMQVQIGADGQPIKQAPAQGQGHDQQCCPCVATGSFAPPANANVFLLLQGLGTARINVAVQEPVIGFVRTPHSPRAPPSFA
jgi:hypothetical protein